MKKRSSFIVLFFIIFFSGLQLQSQTFSWASYPAGATTYTTGNMSVSITSSGAYSQSGSPKYVAAGSNANNPSTGTSYCTSAGLLLAVDWPNTSQNITTTITFATPVCGPLTFSLYDINADFYDDGTTKWTYFTDKIDISATDAASASIPAASISSSGCSSTSSAAGSVKTITANYNNCQCGTNNVTISGSTIKQVVIKYYSGPATYGPTPTYPSWQYIVIGNITATAPPTASITPGVLACGATSTTLTAGTSASSPTYSWSGPGGSTVTSPAAASTPVSGAGIYTLTINPAGCSATATYTLNATGTPPVVTSTGGNTITCSTSSVQTVLTTTSTPVTYTWTGPGIVSGAGSNTMTANAGGTYNYTVTNSSTGCQTSSFVTIASNTIVPDVSAISSGSITCSVSSATLSGNSGIPSPVFAWTGPGTGTPAGSSPNASSTIVSAGGTYSLSVTDPSNGCKSTGTVSVNSNTTLPNSSAGVTQSLSCTTSTVSLNGSSSTPGVSYSWTGPTAGNPAGTAPTNSVTSVTTAGVYTLTVLNPVNGCSKTSTVSVVTNTSTPNLSMGSNQVITCSASSVTLTGSSSTPLAAYSWMGPNTGVPAGSAPTGSATNVTSAGIYTLTVTNPANGCSVSNTLSVSSNTSMPQISMNPGQMISCSSTTVSISGSSSTPGANYSWTGPVVGTPAGATPNASSTAVSSAGIYTLTITSPANGCSITGTVAVTSNSAVPQLSVAGSQTITCSASSATLSGSSPVSGATYAWTGPGAGVPAGSSPAAATTIVSASGNYTLTVTDPATGCTNQAVIPVTTDTLQPVLNMGTNQAITCTTTSATLTANSSTPGAGFSWTGPGSGIPAGSTPGSPTTVVGGSGVYTLTVNNPANGCVSSNTVSVSSNTAIPQVSAGSSQTLTCSTTTVNISGSSSTPGVSYSWTGPASGVAAGSSPTASTTAVSSAGIYTLTVLTVSTGCQNTATVAVSTSSQVPQITIGTNQTITCTDHTVTLSGSSSSAGVSYSWTGPLAGNTAGSTPTATTTQVTQAGIYTLTVTDPVTGCSASQSLSVITDSIKPVITVNASGSATLSCANSSVTFTASAPGNNTLNWTGPGGALSGNPVSVQTSGVYTVQATNPSNGCTASSTVAVSGNVLLPSLSVLPGVDSISCMNPTVSIQATSNASVPAYTWSGPGGYTSSQPTASGIFSPGVYTVVVTDSVSGCSATSTVAITQGSNPQAGFNANPATGTAPLPVQFTNTSSNGFTGFSWSFGDSNTSSATNPANTYTLAGTYTVTLVGIAANPNCNDTISSVIIVTDEEGIEIPNVFTPNGDGANDVFTIKTNGYKDLELVIYNRWGQVLIELSGLNLGWDGVNANGKHAPDGTYFYMLTGTSLSGKSIERTGFLTLFR
ncbi:MAG: gliding motility-associated C-terminal domain-containing protein [Bacteroidetes bacterium]|nr:gliding motility-associated C-terminal domain-containing protein [Bacteroidota bacterium]